MKYIKKNVEAALLNADVTKSIDNKIAKLLKSEICSGFISRKDLKAILTKVYDRLGVAKVAKATDDVVDMYKDDEMLFSYKVKRFGGPCR